MAKSQAKQVHHSEDEYHYFDGSQRILEKPIDRFCLALLNELSTTGGTVWRPTIILKFKDIFEEQQYYIATYGILHKSTLSTSILVRIVQALICSDFFLYSSPNTHFDLELHLRCIVASLRLLSAQGIDRGSGTLSFVTWETLYKRMPKWQEYHNGQVINAKKLEDKIKNYNNEFLIVYAQDLLTSMPNDRTIAANMTTRAIATAAFLGHAYSKNVVEAFNSLKLAVDYKQCPSSWHPRFRSMDDLCLSIRTVRQYYKQTQKAGGDQKPKTEFPDLLDDTELSVVNGLIEILKEELRLGLGSKLGRNIARAGMDALTLNPLSRGNHLMYGILDIIQQHVPAINNGKIDGKVVDIALEVAQQSKYSFLRCKAFEVLAVMRSKFNGMVKERIRDLLENRSLWGTSELREKATEQWKVTRSRVKTMEKILKELRDESHIVEPPLSVSVNSATAGIPVEQTVPVKHLEEILGHLESVENSLICPCGTEDDPDTDLSKLPCGHTISLRAWKQYEIAFRERDTGSRIPCPRCKSPVSDIGKALPMKGIRRAIGEVKENCEWLKGQLTWDGQMEEETPSNENGYDDLLEEEPELAPCTPVSAMNTETTAYLPTASSSSRQVNHSHFSEPNFAEAGLTERKRSRTASPRGQAGISERTSYYHHSTSDASLSGSSSENTCAIYEPREYSSLPLAPNAATTNSGDNQEVKPKTRINSASTTDIEIRPSASPHLLSTSVKSTRRRLLHSPSVGEKAVNSIPGSPSFEEQEQFYNVEHIHSPPPKRSRTYSNTRTPYPSSPGASLHSSSSNGAGKRNSCESTSSVFSRAGSIRSIVQSFNVKSSVVVELSHGGKVFEDNAISSSGDKLALIDKTSFVVLSVPGQSEDLWYSENFTRLCCGFNDGRYGKKVAKAQIARTVIPTYTRTVLSDRSIFIACLEGFVDIHEIASGRRLGKILFSQGRRCWTMAISPNGETLAVALESGEVLLYGEGQTKEFNVLPISVVTEPESKDLRLVNCLAFSPDSLYLSVCTSDNVIRTYAVDIPSHTATFVQSYNRQLDEKACKDPYYGVTDIALYRFFLEVTNGSSSHSSSLLVVSYAKKAYPVLVGNMTLPGKELKIIPMGEGYKDTNCRVAYSPISSAALIITRTGTVKLVNCATNTSVWNVLDLSKEKMDDMKPWRFCNLAFSKDGYRGLALDRRGKLLVVEFSAGRSDTI